MQTSRLLVVLTAMLSCIAAGQTLSSTAVTSPAGPGSVQPNWSVTPDGAAVLSWTEPAKDGTSALRYAVRRGAAWSASVTIAAHRHFFRHPAEVPEVVQTADGHWLAHWVENQESSEAEFVYVSSSTDGMHWTAPAQAHRDHSPVQHGLASMIENPGGGASIFWLEALKGEDGPVYLMRSVVDASGKEVNEERLDDDVCACCPTAAAKTSKGLIVAYRDHTPKDIRDIAVLRLENGKWSPSKIVYNDNWHIDACPINAAAVAARGDRVAVAWFTGAQDSPKVKIAFSSDAGATFGKPAVFSTGHAFGYTSVILDDAGTALVSWLEQGPSGARVLVRSVNAAGMAGPVLEIAKGEKMVLGYPKLARAGRETLVAWGSPSKIQIASIR
ncbi:MAG TPA: sialidase family protein [Bryobacteraceae bacterium]|nr:sialidase family protein [Bryobacteraceae bacterium]